MELVQSCGHDMHPILIPRNNISTDVVAVPFMVPPRCAVSTPMAVGTLDCAAMEVVIFCRRQCRVYESAVERVALGSDGGSQLHTLLSIG